MNRTNTGSGDHSPKRRQNILLFDNKQQSKSTPHLLKSPTKRADVQYARNGKGGPAPIKRTNNNESEDLKILRNTVLKYEMQLRTIEKETAEHRLQAKEVNERANQLMKQYAAEIQKEDKIALKNTVNKYNLAQWIDMIQLSAQKNTKIYDNLGTTLKSISQVIRSISNGSFKNSAEHDDSEDDDTEPASTEQVNDSVTKVEATTSNMLRLSKHIMSVAKKCIEERSQMLPKKELEQQMTGEHNRAPSHTCNVKKEHPSHGCVVN